MSITQSKSISSRTDTAPQTLRKGQLNRYTRYADIEKRSALRTARASATHTSILKPFIHIQGKRGRTAAGVDLDCVIAQSTLDDPQLRSWLHSSQVLVLTLDEFSEAPSRALAHRALPSGGASSGSRPVPAPRFELALELGVVPLM